MLQTNYLRENLESIDLKGWALVDLPPEFCRALLTTAQAKFNDHLFKAAQISKSSDIENSIRSDMTLWLEQTSNEQSESQLWQFLETIKSELSQFFRIHLSHFECHYAVYKPGRFYGRHSDQTAHNNQRFFSFVIYLNEGWLTKDGGQLKAYTPDNQILFEIQPEFGKMIVFKSDIEHEVTEAYRSRWSITGWFRK